MTRARIALLAAALRWRRILAALLLAAARLQRAPSGVVLRRNC